MPNNYIAPYLISTEPPVAIPATGVFTVPVCTTSERFDKIMAALFAYGAMQGDEFDFDHLIDWLDALPRITEGCEPRNPVCRTIALNDSMISWFPESPYNPDEEIPEGYTYHPWTITDTSILGTIISMWGFGYRVGDVYTDFTKLPAASSWEDVFANLGNMPSFTITGLEGTGTVKIHLLNIPQGGRVLVQIDDAFNPLALTLAELNKDLISFPQETLTAFIIEVEIDTAGTHAVKLSFLPTVDDAFIPIFFGGGIRSIELCGFGVTDMPENCCDETNQLLTTNNAYLAQVVSLLQGGFKLVPINSGVVPDAIATGECVPTNYDSDGDDAGGEIALRAAALCYVIHCYVTEILYKACLAIGVPSLLLDSVFPDHATMPQALHRIIIDYPPQLTLVALIENLASAGIPSSMVECAMLASLRGKLNVFSTFRDSVTIFGGFGSLVVPIAGLVRFQNQSVDNWHIFNDALAEAMSMPTEVAAYECICELDVDCSEPLQLIIIDGRGTIELVEGYTTLYHLTGDPATFDGVNYHGGVYVRDAHGRTLSVWHSEVVELPTQAPLYHHIIGRCGTPDSTGLLGGWAGLTEDTVFVERFYQDSQTGPTDTYYNITCIDECP